MADFPTTEDILGYGRDENVENYDFTQAALAAAKTILNNSCGRQFVIASGSSARVFVPASYELVYIDDCTSVSSVTSDGQSVSASYYQLEPLNGRTVAGESVPYHKIRRITGLWSVGANHREATISVTATWGWAAIPSEIIEACKILVSDIVANREVRFGVVQATEAGAIVARTNPVVRQAIDTYRRSDSLFIA